MDERNSVLMNLRDAGLNKAQVEEFMQTFDKGQMEYAIRLLRKYRPELMEEMHKSQQRVDCLDFLMHRLEKVQRAK